MFPLQLHSSLLTPSALLAARPPASLTSLPSELLHYIISHLDYKSLLHTSLTHFTLTHPSQHHLWRDVEFYSSAPLELALASHACGRFLIRKAVFGGSWTDDLSDDPGRFAKGVREMIERVGGYTDLAMIGVIGLGLEVLGAANLAGESPLTTQQTLSSTN